MKNNVTESLYEEYYLKKAAIYAKHPAVLLDSNFKGTIDELALENEKVAAKRVTEFKQAMPEIEKFEESDRKTNKIITGLFIGLALLTIIFIISTTAHIPALTMLMMLLAVVDMAGIAYFSIVGGFFITKNSKTLNLLKFDIEKLVADDLLIEFGIKEEFIEEETSELD